MQKNTYSSSGPSKKKRVKKVKLQLVSLQQRVKRSRKKTKPILFLVISRP